MQKKYAPRMTDYVSQNRVFPKWGRTFIEFAEFRESEKSLKHELGSI